MLKTKLENLDGIDDGMYVTEAHLEPPLALNAANVSGGPHLVISQRRSEGLV